MFFFCADGVVALVWILWHSYVYWGAKGAEKWRSGRQIGIRREEAVVRWIGVRGLVWSRFLVEYQMYVHFDGHPDILVIHAGGNDIGVRASREIIRDIKLDMLRVMASHSGVVIVWSDIVARTKWRQARLVDRLNKARIKINKAVGKFVKRNGGVVVRHTTLETNTEQYLRPDGVHLNEIGLQWWLYDMKEGIITALQVWRDDRV